MSQTPRIQTIQPENWPQPRGYANGILTRGPLLHIAGQIGWDERGDFRSAALPDQFAQALDSGCA